MIDLIANALIAQGGEITTLANAFGAKLGGVSTIRSTIDRYGLSSAGKLLMGLRTTEQEKYEDELKIIAKHSPIDSFTHLSMKEFKRDPKAVADMAVRYGFQFSPLTKLLGDNLLEQEPILRESLERLLKCVDPYIVNEAIEQIDVEALKTYPDHIIELAVLTGNRFDDALRCLPKEAFDFDPDSHLVLARRLKEHTWGAFAQGDALFYLSEEGEKLITKIESLLGQHFAHELGDILAELDIEGGAQAARNLFDDVSIVGAGAISDTLSELNATQLSPENANRVVMKLLGGSSSFLRYFNKPEHIPHLDILMECARFAPNTLEYVFDFVPLKLLQKRPYELRDLFKDFGETTWGLLCQFGDQVFKREQKIYLPTAREIAKFCSESGGYIFANLHPDEWESVGMELVKKYQQSAGHLVSIDHYGPELSDPIYEQNRQHFGLRSFHRYLLGGKDKTFLLEENLKNLDPEYNSDKPYAVIIVAHSDHNDSVFLNGLAYRISQLAATYQLVLFEVGSVDELGYSVQMLEDIFMAKKERLNAAGCFILACHGDWESLVLGKPPKGFSRKGSELQIGDQELVRRFGKLFYPGARGFLDACSTFHGGPDAENIGNMFSDEMPHVEIQGATIPCGSDGLIFNDDWEPAEWSFDLHPSQFVKKEARESLKTY